MVEGRVCTEGIASSRVVSTRVVEMGTPYMMGNYVEG